MTLRIKRTRVLPRLFGFWKAKEWFAATLSHDWYWWERHYRSIWIHWTTEQMGTWFQKQLHVSSSTTCYRHMHLQQDLYDLSVDCFNHLSSRIDDVAHQICVVHGQSEAGEAKPDSKFQGGQVRRWPCKGPWGLDGFSRAKTSFTGPTRLIPVRTSVKTMWAVWAYRLVVLKAALLKIEVQNWMPFLLRAGRLVQKLGTLGGLGRMQSQSFRSSPVESSLVQERRDVSRMRRLDTTAFRSFVYAICQHEISSCKSGGKRSKRRWRVPRWECLRLKLFTLGRWEISTKHGQMLNILLWFDYIIKRYKTDKTANIANRRHLTCMCFK